VPAAVPEDIVGLASRQVAGKLCVWSSRRRARDLCGSNLCARVRAPRAAGFVKYCAVIRPLNCTVVCVEYDTVVSCNFLVAPRGCVCESVCGLPFSLPVLA